MDLLIQGAHGFVVSDKTKAYVLKRIDKINYFKTHINDLTIQISEEKIKFKIDATLNLKKLGSYKFGSNDKELYNAIDKLVHKIDVKVNRKKGKIRDRSRGSRDEVVEFFFEHSENKPEPTSDVNINQKPQTLLDAVLLAKESSSSFMGFYMVQDEKIDTPVFLRKIDNETFFLLKIRDNSSYGEYSLKVSSDKCEIDKEARTLPLKKRTLLKAQKDVLKNDFHYGVYIDAESDKICLLYKSNNGKWKNLK